MSNEFENNNFIDPSPSVESESAADISDGNCMSLPISEKNFLSESYEDNTENDSEVTSIYESGQKLQTKGRNTFAFWIVIGLLFIITIGNLILTITIIGVLKLSKGMQSIELVPEEQSLKFYGDADMDRIYKRDGIIEGFVDEPVTIGAETGGSVLINLVHRNGMNQNKVVMDNEGVTFCGIDKFEMKDALSGEMIFTTNRPHYNIPEGVDNLHTKAVSSSRISSAVDEAFTLENEDEAITAKGSEGISMDATDINFETDQNITLKSTVSIILSSDNVFLATDDIRVASTKNGLHASNLQYKLCVCMPQGKLFRLEIPPTHTKVTCNHYDPSDDPCA